jgi:hypothetical protein
MSSDGMRGDDDDGAAMVAEWGGMDGVEKVWPSATA